MRMYFLSPRGGTGRTTLLMNTAVGLARSGLRVTCVDFDFGAPGLSRWNIGEQERSYSSRELIRRAEDAELDAQTRALLDHITIDTLRDVRLSRAWSSDSDDQRLPLDRGQLSLVRINGVSASYVQALYAAGWGVDIDTDRPEGRMVAARFEMLLRLFESVTRPHVMLIDFSPGLGFGYGLCIACCLLHDERQGPGPTVVMPSRISWQSEEALYLAGAVRRTLATRVPSADVVPVLSMVPELYMGSEEYRTQKARIESRAFGKVGNKDAIEIRYVFPLLAALGAKEEALTAAPRGPIASAAPYWRFVDWTLKRWMVKPSAGTSTSASIDPTERDERLRWLLGEHLDDIATCAVSPAQKAACIDLLSGRASLDKIIADMSPFGLGPHRGWERLDPRIGHGVSLWATGSSKPDDSSPSSAAAANSPRDFAWLVNCLAESTATEVAVAGTVAQLPMTPGAVASIGSELQRENELEISRRGLSLAKEEMSAGGRASSTSQSPSIRDFAIAPPEGVSIDIVLPLLANRYGPYVEYDAVEAVRVRPRSRVMLGTQSSDDFARRLQDHLWFHRGHRRQLPAMVVVRVTPDPATEFVHLLYRSPESAANSDAGSWTPIPADWLDKVPWANRVLFLVESTAPECDDLVATHLNRFPGARSIVLLRAVQDDSIPDYVCVPSLEEGLRAWKEDLGEVSDDRGGPDADGDKRASGLVVYVENQQPGRALSDTIADAPILLSPDQEERSVASKTEVVLQPFSMIHAPLFPPSGAVAESTPNSDHGQRVIVGNKELADWHAGQQGRAGSTRHVLSINTILLAYHRPSFAASSPLQEPYRTWMDNPDAILEPPRTMRELMRVAAFLRYRLWRDRATRPETSTSAQGKEEPDYGLLLPLGLPESGSDLPAHLPLWSNVWQLCRAATDHGVGKWAGVATKRLRALWTLGLPIADTDPQSQTPTRSSHNVSWDGARVLMAEGRALMAPVWNDTADLFRETATMQASRDIDFSLCSLDPTKDDSAEPTSACDGLLAFGSPADVGRLTRLLKAEALQDSLLRRGAISVDWLDGGAPSSSEKLCASVRERFDHLSRASRLSLQAVRYARRRPAQDQGPDNGWRGEIDLGKLEAIAQSLREAEPARAHSSVKDFDEWYERELEPGTST